MDINEGQSHWISEDKMYLPTAYIGLNGIELESFFQSIRPNWIKRYILEKYDDFWTSILDNSLGV